MAEISVEDDGTVALPAALLRAANLHPGDAVSIVLTMDGAIVLRAAALSEPGAPAPDPAGDDLEPMSTDEFMAWLDVMAGVTADVQPGNE
ncbi:MAG TPA: hypothetical protein VN697_01960 [Tepidiformaceae bacterium]|nr:hypothetical protein [Tepidiformaceae bacterium]